MGKREVLFVIVIITMALYSCSEEDDSIAYPLNYESKSINEIRLGVYTKNGKLTDNDLIDDIVNRYEAYLTELEDVAIIGEIKLTYPSPNEVEIREANSNDVDYRDEYKISDIYYWERQDTIDVSGSLSEFEKFFKYHPIYQEEFPNPFSYGSYTIFKHCYYAKKANGKILFPMLDFAIVNNPFVNHPQISSSRINNEFDENTITKLGVNDTLIIQEYTIEFR